MKYRLHSHRHAIEVAQNNERYCDTFNELLDILDNISDQDIINEFQKPEYQNNKSISRTINNLIDARLVQSDWSPQSHIFQHEDYINQRFRLDFAKRDFAVEVAFNHGEAISWNLLKPVLSS